MKKELQELIAALEKEGNLNASSIALTILKKAQTYSVQDWQSVITEVDTPYPDKVIMGIVNYFTAAEENLQKADKELSGVDKETIQEAAETMKKLSSQVEMTDENIMKFSKLMSYNENSEIRKQAQMGWLGKALTGGAKVIPVVGALFSTLFAIKSIAYGIYEFAELIKQTTKINLEWYQAFDPKNFHRIAFEAKDDPNELKEITKAIKISNLVWDEAIASLTNTIDAVKDWIFLVLDFMSFGTSVWIDLGLSAIFLAAELGGQTWIGTYYKEVLDKIKDFAQLKIDELNAEKTEEPGETSEDPLYTEDELEKWWADLKSA